MEAIKETIKFFIKASFAFFFFAFVWWLVSIFVPYISFSNIFSSFKTENKKDILPSPRLYSSLLGQKATPPNEKTNLYTPSNVFNGYSLGSYDGKYSYIEYDYVTYDSSGNLVRTPGYRASNNNTVTRNMASSSIPKQPVTAFSDNRSLNIRNLSIYEGGSIYTGLTFIGEAKNIMFKDGKFPIVVLDNLGKIVGVSAGIARTDWTIPGWTRFETKIMYTLPVNTPCLMIFEEALTEKEKRERLPLRIPLSIKCN